MISAEIMQIYFLRLITLWSTESRGLHLHNNYRTALSPFSKHLCTHAKHHGLDSVPKSATRFWEIDHSWLCGSLLTVWLQVDRSRYNYTMQKIAVVLNYENSFRYDKQQVTGERLDRNHYDGLLYAYLINSEIKRTPLIFILALLAPLRYFSSTWNQCFEPKSRWKYHWLCYATYNLPIEWHWPFNVVSSVLTAWSRICLLSALCWYRQTILKSVSCRDPGLVSKFLSGWESGA